MSHLLGKTGNRLCRDIAVRRRGFRRGHQELLQQRASFSRGPDLAQKIDKVRVHQPFAFHFRLTPACDVIAVSLTEE